MEVLSYTEFRKNLAKSLNKVIDDAEIVIVSRAKGKNIVVMDFEEYNGTMETLYLTKFSANSKRLEEAVAEMTRGNSSGPEFSSLNQISK
jgi:antitoxin YefM